MASDLRREVGSRYSDSQFASRVLRGKNTGRPALEAVCEELFFCCEEKWAANPLPDFNLIAAELGTIGTLDRRLLRHTRDRMNFEAAIGRRLVVGVEVDLATGERLAIHRRREGVAP